MFQLEKSFFFEAGHVLCHHDGKCRNPHGHSYELTVYVRGQELLQDGPKRNMVLDFIDISSVVKEMINRYFDHQWLNDTLNSDSPTIEFIAKWIYDYLKTKLPGLSAVSIHETASSRVIYSE